MGDWKRLPREEIKHEDGSRSITDVSVNKKTLNLRSHVYNLNSDSSEHDHVVQDYDGKDLKYRAGHGPEKKTWRDLALSWLQFMTYEELQIIEAYSDNEYIKLSAKRLLTIIHQHDVMDTGKTLVKRR